MAFSLIQFHIKPLTIITKRSILDVAAALDPPLKTYKIEIVATTVDSFYPLAVVEKLSILDLCGNSIYASVLLFSHHSIASKLQGVLQKKYIQL